ncbi:hypothetical protein FAZ19_16185 [Sphingobacterium alkalisoli]|uniref:Uncharacterized protein n=1 Tax=Sphingobacterium alkalisoli TaxID=1874115 RepID=A0A4U0GXB5_9SPHI|nr:hypothetical protein [Sphingobacterium alkalisoli]TJY63805.1 hypothetical protein FAZ19_16185 [Sphingobacterium alkalisoli]
MELRKVKITKSIFNQLLAPGLASLLRDDQYEVLGWVFDRIRYILIYDQETKALYRLPLIKDMKIEQQRPQIVNFNIKGYASSVQLSGYNESNRWITRVHEIQTEARVKGQIFI